MVKESRFRSNRSDLASENRPVKRAGFNPVEKRSISALPLRPQDLPGNISRSREAGQSKFTSVKDRSIDALRNSGLDSAIDEDINRDLDNLESSIGISGSLGPNNKGQFGINKNYLALKALETQKTKKRYSELNE